MNPQQSSRSPERFWRKALMVSLGFFIVPPLIGTSFTVFGMIRAFNDIESDNSGLGDPKALSENIALAMNTTAIGLVIAFFGMIGVVISLIRYLSSRKYKTLPTA